MNISHCDLLGKKCTLVKSLGEERLEQKVGGGAVGGFVKTGGWTHRDCHRIDRWHDRERRRVCKPR